MKLRKINAALSLLATAMIMAHAVSLSVWMLSRCSIAKTDGVMPRVLTVVMVIHAVLSMVLVIGNRKEAQKQTHRAYPKLNISTYAQRITGVLMLLLLGIHIMGTMNHFQPKMLHAVLHPLFFAAVLVHTAVSTGKALITLGIGNARAIRVVNAVVMCLCGVTLAAGVVGFYLCLFLGVAR